MNKAIVSMLLLGLITVAACKKSEDPAPQAVDFQLTEARLNGQPVVPLPAYTITLRFDAEGIPTDYEATGSHPAAPALDQQGTWQQDGTQITFTSGNGSGTRTVQVSGAQVDALSSQIELSWSLSKTEIDWEKVGDYTYSFTRME
ncbi:MAG: hypothetical protein AAF944_28275 [Bacteroidota bacterium]